MAAHQTTDRFHSGPSLQKKRQPLQIDNSPNHLTFIRTSFNTIKSIYNLILTDGESKYF